MQAVGNETRAQTPVAWRHGLAHDVATVIASFWLVAGLHLDGWAHAHKPGLESFLTPWHAALYSGFFALAGVTIWGAWVRRAAGEPLAEMRVSLLGMGIFFAGGVLDMIWHLKLGIEVSIEALLSPTHMMLAIGIFLLVSAPLRRAWRVCKGAHPGFPALVSASLLLALVAFFTQFLQPGGRPWPLAGNKPTFALFTVENVTPDFPVFPGGVPSTEIAIILGMGGMLFATMLAVGFALLLARHFTLRFGHMTLVLGFSALMLGTMRDTLFLAPAWIVAGIAADLALRSAWRPLLIMALALPLALWGAYFAEIAWAGGVWWSVHAWAGAIVVCTLFGLLIGVAFEAERGSAAAPGAAV